LADPGTAPHETRPTHDPDPVEPNLIERAKRGDHGAFEQIYRRSVARVYGLCLRLVANPVQAEILTQDVFVRVWQKMDSFRAQGSFSAWLYRVTVNVVVEDRRAQARRSRHEESLGDETMEPMAAGRGASTGSGAFAAGRMDASIDLERAVAALPHGARQAFVLYDVYGFRHAEIAQLMGGIAPGTVKAQLHRARKLIRGMLGGPGEEAGP